MVRHSPVDSPAESNLSNKHFIDDRYPDLCCTVPTRMPSEVMDTTHGNESLMTMSIDLSPPWLADEEFACGSNLSLAHQSTKIMPWATRQNISHQVTTSRDPHLKV